MIDRGPPDRERLDWAVRALEAAKNGQEEPEPPDSIKRERAQRRRDRKAQRASARAVEEGIIQNVPLDDRCIGLGARCTICGRELPEPGDPPQRCSNTSPTVESGHKG